MRESTAEFAGFLIVPCQHVSVVNVRKEQWSTRLGDGRGAAIEYKEKPCIVGRDSQTPEGEYHAVYENAMNDM